MDVNAYLNRIGASGKTTPSTESLRALHRAHLMNVPFENLDIHLKEQRPIVLTEEALFDKIVGRKRGGYCYELNFLLAKALEQLGYEVTLLSARPKVSIGNYSPDFDHLVLMVQLEDRWLVDVGFGDGFLEPLHLDTTENQRQRLLDYRIETQPRDHLLLLRTDEAGVWWDQYVFTLTPRTIEEFEGRNQHHQFAPQSHFVRSKVVTKATDEGRVTMSNLLLITTKGFKQESEQLPGLDRFHEILHDTFEIDPKDVSGLI